MEGVGIDRSSDSTYKEQIGCFIFLSKTEFNRSIKTKWEIRKYDIISSTHFSIKGQLVKTMLEHLVYLFRNKKL